MGSTRRARGRTLACEGAAPDDEHPGLRRVSWLPLVRFGIKVADDVLIKQ
jgi:hypothetical protein